MYPEMFPPLTEDEDIFCLVLNRIHASCKHKRSCSLSLQPLVILFTFMREIRLLRDLHAELALRD